MSARRPDETELLSLLIGDIYDASLDPALWRPVLEKTCCCIKTAAAAMMVHTSPPEATALSVSCGAEEKYANSYSTYNAINPLNVPTLLHARPGSVVAAADLLPYEEYGLRRSDS
jgi:hypothetical protein